MSRCARPNCHTIAMSSCSGCVREQYCSGVCQKVDWKIHKSMCPILKKLSNNLQPYQEVVRVIDEILASKKASDTRILEHLLSYAEYQFGKQVPEVGYRERTDGQRIRNWEVDIATFLAIHSRFVNIYGLDDSLSNLIRDNKKHHHLEKSIHLLRPWLVHLDSDASNRIGSITTVQKDHLLEEVRFVEENMALITMNRNQLDAAERHCQRCLSYSRRFGVEGEYKTTMVFRALSAYIQLRCQQYNDADAVTYAEDAYNLVVVAYDPVHIQVQEAAGTLINCLMNTGKLFDAERYAQVTYSNLRDSKNGIDQESEAVAQGSYILADVIFRQFGDAGKAEELAREALRIRSKLYDSGHMYVGISCNLLAKILWLQSNLGVETKKLYERSLAIFIRNEGLDGLNTAAINISIGQFYFSLAHVQPTVDTKRTQLLKAKSCVEEAVRINTKLHGSTHSSTIEAASLLPTLLGALSTV